MNRSLARSNIYRMLSIFFAYPKESVRSLIMNDQRQRGLRESLNMLDEEYFAGCLEDLKNVCSLEKMPSKREMTQEYERVFGDSRPDINKALAASSYMRDIWSVLHGKKCSAAGSYKDFGSEFKKTKRPMSDMICHRLKLMGILAELESKAACIEKIRLEEIQLDFFSKFIVPCIADFCDELIRNSFLDFYRALGILTREFVKFEENYLGVPEEVEKG
jgi:TorA maturation chaperone TorD